MVRKDVLLHARAEAHPPQLPRITPTPAVCRLHPRLKRIRALRMHRRRSKPRNNHLHNGGRLTIGVVIPVFARSQVQFMQCGDGFLWPEWNTRWPELTWSGLCHF